MNPDPIDQRLRETGWRRPLTEAEQAELNAWLVAHPEQQSDAETDAALTQTLAKLPDAPMPFNFTARVLQAIEREASTTDRAATKPSAPWWRVLFPRIAAAAVVVGASVLGYRHHQTVQREELADAAKNLVTVASATPLPDLTVLKDFDAIRSMSQADEGLLALSEDLLSLKQ
jgi:anti-sigma factor RsiW